MTRLPEDEVSTRKLISIAWRKKKRRRRKKGEEGGDSELDGKIAKDSSLVRLSEELDGEEEEDSGRQQERDTEGRPSLGEETVVGSLEREAMALRIPNCFECSIMDGVIG
ncbi:hypothetical protein MLD38_011024 [Melastoma candidum]|uniref:Uncharacterized protein n=2 Tax=Melastoma candidum TaxID=119954 RepID=A0ACB9R1R7_9MYRT|nr:hypothetical protein MLD38_011023 [Melastoma candidum]KAI4372840.1 hypothetical protein MLD38_011024 [Melastoma candidum]